MEESYFLKSYRVKAQTLLFTFFTLYKRYQKAQKHHIFTAKPNLKKPLPRLLGINNKEQLCGASIYIKYYKYQVYYLHEHILGMFYK